MDTQQEAVRARQVKQRKEAEVGESTASSVEPMAAVPTVAELSSLRTTLEDRHTETLGRVGALLREQQDLTGGIATELSSLQKGGDNLRELEEADADQASIIAQIKGRLTRRRRLLERQSVATRLQEQYRTVHTTLRKAGAFADELQLCAVELAQEVDRLHSDVDNSLEQVVRIEQRVADLQAELTALDARSDPTERRRRDQIRFEIADLGTAASLHNAKAHLCNQQVDPARALRDTVHGLHKEMAHYVLQASASVEGSGRRIQTLGLAADAPVVISELQDGLHQLDAAMTVTQAYLDQAHDMLTRVLPELTQQIQIQGSRAAVDLEQGLAAIEAARQGEASDDDLRAAAFAEVELLGVELAAGNSEAG